MNLYVVLKYNMAIICHKNMLNFLPTVYLKQNSSRICVLIRSPGSDISLFLLLRFIAILIRFIELLYRFIELL